MCDDVSANKSLYGNERETPSIRSQVRFAQGMAWCGTRGLVRGARRAGRRVGI
jgi:hypothetical protein